MTRKFLYPCLMMMVIGAALYYLFISSDNEIPKYISKVNDRLTYLQLKKSTSPNISEAEYVDQYVLTLKSEYLNKKVHYFQAFDYTIETGGSPSVMGTSNICKAIDSLYDKPEPIIEIIKNSNIKIDLYGVSVELKELIAEMLYSIRKVIDLKTKKVRIYLKGYADGSKSKDWKRKLKDFPYNYNTIDFLPTIDTNSLNPIRYRYTNKKLNIKDKFYTNKDLPFLRANFIKKDFIEPFIQNCLNEKIEIKILEGYEFKKADMPLNRKVEIYIQFFEK